MTLQRHTWLEQGVLHQVFVVLMGITCWALGPRLLAKLVLGDIMGSQIVDASVLSAGQDCHAPVLVGGLPQLADHLCYLLVCTCTEESAQRSN
jgi:hypothetical protein